MVLGPGETLSCPVVDKEPTYYVLEGNKLVGALFVSNSQDHFRTR